MHHVKDTPTKSELAQQELGPGDTLDLENYDPYAEFGGEEERRKLEKRLLLKLDLRMSILIIIYILNYIDRNNASAARLRGFETDLGLKGEQFATILSILYVGYILMQVPSNMLLAWMGKPSLYLPICVAIWGTISILTGITQNFVGALLTRFMLGFVEAAFFPGALFLLSKWYKREELGLRTALLYCGNLISNAFGPLIAAGILDTMEGKLGNRAWRWLFFIEGAMTVFVAILAIAILPDFPETSRFLSPAERKLAILRMAEDTGKTDQQAVGEGVFVGFKLAMLDNKVWMLALGLTAQVVGLSFNAYFPTLTSTLGYSRTISLLLCAPPWFFATICAFVWARHSDKTLERTWHITASLCIGLVGFIIGMSTQITGARYVALFLQAQSYSGFICYFAWMSNSIIRPVSKRAVALAFINAFSQLGNVAGSYVWSDHWKPSFLNSYAITTSCFGAALLIIFSFRLVLMRINKQIEAIEAVYPGDPWDAPTEDGEPRDEALNVKRGFRYAL